VPSEKRARQRANREVKQAAQAKVDNRRRLLRNGIVIVVIAAVVVGTVYLITKKNSSKSATTTTTTLPGEVIDGFGKGSLRVTPVRFPVTVSVTLRLSDYGIDAQPSVPPPSDITSHQSCTVTSDGYNCQGP